MYSSVEVTNKSLFNKVLMTFVITLLLATVGLYIGQFVPPVYIIPLAIAELVMIIFAFWLKRKKNVGYLFVFLFSLISGVTTYPIVAYYTSIAGANIALMAVGSTFVNFGVMAVVGSVTKKDLSFMGSFLMVAVLAMLAVFLYNIFIIIAEKTPTSRSGTGVAQRVGGG